MTPREKLRDLLKDAPKPTVLENLGGDGQRTDFLPNLIESGRALFQESPTPTATVFVDDVLQVITTDYTIIQNQIFRFVTAPTGRVEITYYTVVFTNSELDNYLAQSKDSVERAEISALITLGTDSAKFFAKTGFSLQDDKSEISANFIRAANAKIRMLKEIGSTAGASSASSVAGGADVDVSYQITDTGVDVTEYPNG